MDKYCEKRYIEFNAVRTAITGLIHSICRDTKADKKMINKWLGEVESVLPQLAYKTERDLRMESKTDLMEELKIRCQEMQSKDEIIEATKAKIAEQDRDIAYLRGKIDAYEYSINRIGGGNGDT